MSTCSVRFWAAAGALLLAACSAVADVTEVVLKGPFAWGDRNLYVVEPGASSPSVAVITGVVAVASSAPSAPNADTTARLEFVGGEPWFYTPAAGWTKLAGAQALAEGVSAAYQMVFDFAEDRACCTVGGWSVGWVPFGGGDELVGYSEQTGTAAAVMSGEDVPDEYDPTIPKTQWTWSSSAKTLTEVVPEGHTPWKFKLTSGGTLSLAAEVDSTSSTKINLRTLPADCPYQIKSTGKNGGYFMCNVSGLSYTGDYSSSAGAIIEEIYFPDTLTTLYAYSFANCTNLVVCDFTENSQLETVQCYAFWKNGKLRKLRLTDRLKRLEGGVANTGTIVSCDKLRFVGPTLSTNLTYMARSAISSCPNAIQGRLTLGGDRDDITYLNGKYMFRDATGVTEVVFGKAVTTFASTLAFSGCTGITNIVCRNPAGFNFGTYFSTLSGLKQYDLFGWPTGTLVTKNYLTRILAPRNNATWRALVADETVFTPWNKLTSAQQATYWTNFPSNGVENVRLPAGRIAGTKGTKTYAGCTFGYGVWVVFDKGTETMIYVR